MMRRPIPFSTMTAATLMTTSRQPISAPNTRITGTAVQSESTSVTASRIQANRIPVATSTRRQPSRAESAPESGIVASEPMPMHSSKSPSTSSPIASRSRSTGTSGAHDAEPNPPIKKNARVACASRAPITRSRPPLSIISLSSIDAPSPRREKLLPFYHRT